MPVGSAQTSTLLGNLAWDWHLLLQGDVPAMVIEIMTAHGSRGEIAGRGRRLSQQQETDVPHYIYSLSESTTDAKQH